MTEFKTELPLDVDVETVTFIAYSDGRPSEVVLAGTTNPSVRAGHLSESGGALLQETLLRIVGSGLVDGPADAAG